MKTLSIHLTQNEKCKGLRLPQDRTSDRKTIMETLWYIAFSTSQNLNFNQTREHIWDGSHTLNNHFRSQLTMSCFFTSTV